MIFGAGLQFHHAFSRSVCDERKQKLVLNVRAGQTSNPRDASHASHLLRPAFSYSFADDCGALRRSVRRVWGPVLADSALRAGLSQASSDSRVAILYEDGPARDKA